MVIRSKYQIMEHLGSGGMADVYKVKHIAFSEIFAIKVVKPSYAEDESFNHRFKSEAILSRRLRHPHAISVEDFDVTEDGRPFIVMELVEGKSLRELVKNSGAIAMERALELTRQVASALSAAHALGIIHRDVKPDNILITTDAKGQESVKVLDFGIARVREGAITGGFDHTATRSGMLMGTPAYMSPEQALGKVGDQIDGRSDVYSLGIVLYEMLTGALPFRSETPMGYLIEHINTSPVPPRTFAPQRSISSSVSRLVMKALEKDRENRFATMKEMEQALASPDDWIASLPPETIAQMPKLGETRDDATLLITPDSAAETIPTPIPTPIPSPKEEFRPAPETSARVESQPRQNGNGKKSRSPKRPTPRPAPVPAAVQDSTAKPEAPAVVETPVAPKYPEPKVYPSRAPEPPAPKPELKLTEPPSRSRAGVWTVAVCIVLAVAAAGGYLWVKQSSTPPTAAPTTAAETTPAPVEMVNMISPKHEVEQVSKDEVAGKEKSGYKHGENLWSPTGVRSYISADKYQEAVKNGYTISKPSAKQLAKQNAKEPAEPAANNGRQGSQGDAKSALVRSYVAKGEQYLGSGNYVSAISNFQNALELDPSNAAASAGLRKAQAAERDVVNNR
jgi:serine/threonine-protein kinase